ncbi:MAG: hypothetical protein E7582_01590 [Ruminococcaceae bacterium]|nr:hypothetical protein [Oscillospiraceae bacterium]
MLLNKLKNYVDKFNSDDCEMHKNTIDNSRAFEFLKENIPLFECPDATLEEIYYFRWWTFRKHIKHTCDGYVITEFLPNVPWASLHNAIVAPFGHQVNEAKWLKCGKEILADYTQFYLDKKGNIYDYSTWFIYSVLEYCIHCNNMEFAIKNLDLLVQYFETFEKAHITDTGLYFSYDGDDAMECSISGGRTIEEKAFPGLRPTLNSYMAGNAFALSKIAKASGRLDLEEKYRKKGEFIIQKMIELLWDGSFFKATHSLTRIPANFPKVTEVQQDRNARELIGYLPWYFNLMPKGYEKVFRDLTDPCGFMSNNGLTTAEQRHPRFMYSYPHSCLWNGYVWPYATTQTLVAVINLLENYEQEYLTYTDFYKMVSDYAKMHYRVMEDGKKICWIDEVKDPITDEWSSRKVLENWGWPERKGGVERGRDYNHSAFCHIVLRGVLGIKSNMGKLEVTPNIPENWDYFLVDNLWIDGVCYKVLYDKTGKRYGEGEGLKIIKK